MISSLKLLLVVAALTLLCVLSLAENAGWGTELVEAGEQPQTLRSSFALAISAVKDVIQADGPVEVKVITTDTSTQPVYFYWPVSEHGALLAFKYDVRDGNGDVPPDTILSRKCRYASGG
jgi:hypothetical protein